MMKKKKLVIASAVLLLGCVATSGCDEDLPTTKTHQSINSTQTTRVIKSAEKQDGSKDTETVQASHSIVKSCGSDLENTVKEKTGRSSKRKQKETASEEDSIFLTIVLWLSVLASLAISLFTLAKYKDFNKVTECLGDEIDLLKKDKNNIQPRSIKSARPKQSTPTNLEYQTLSDRIAELERQFKQNKPYKLKDSKCHNNIIVNTTGALRKGYFSSPTQSSETEAYFSHIIDTKDSEARFSVEVSNDKAEFKPLEGQMSLNNIKSDDVMKLVLELTGCALREATQMKVLMPGQARLEDGYWVVTKKAQVNLTR